MKKILFALSMLVAASIASSQPPASLNGVSTFNQFGVGGLNLAGLVFYNTTTTAAPTLSACGTTPSIDAHANNKSGTVTAGTGTVTTCTVTFAGSGYNTWNHCRLAPHSILASMTYTYTLTTMTITATTLTSAVLDYDCDGY